MNRFVFGYQKELDDIVEQDMCLIIRTIKKEIGSIDAIILEGSFGRGEGAMIYKDDCWIPINDYDMCIVVDKCVKQHEINSIKRKVLLQSDISRIDIAVMSKDKLRSLKPRMLFFDRKYGSQVIYGDTQILDTIPDMKSSDIPWFEAEKEYYTRIVSFILSMKKEFIVGKKRMNQADEFLLRQQVSKSLIACANAQLILNGKYRASLVERQDTFEKMSPFEQEIMDLIRDAFHFKLKPTFDQREDIIEYYFHCRDIYLHLFLDFLSSMYKREILSWDSCVNTYLKSPRNNAKRFIFWLKGDDSLYQGLHLNVTQLLLVASLQKNGTLHENEMNMCRDNLKKICNLSEIPLEWDGLRDVILSLRM